MRLFEILTLLSLLATTASLFQRPDGRPGWLRAGFLAPAGFVLLHLIFEGSRWQMTPFYFLAVIFALLALRQFRKRGDGDGATRDRKGLRLSGAFSALLLLLLASPLPYLFPVFEIADPGGPYPIGTKMFRFIDETRPETFSPQDDDFREVTVQVWYPATLAPGSRPEPYREPEQAGVLSRQMTHFLSLFGPMPPFVENHFPLVKTHAYKNAPVSTEESAYPVLLYSHGILFGHVRTHTVLMEALASHGYIVASVGHAYQSPFFQYPDGTVKLFPLDSDIVQKTAVDFFGADNQALLQKIRATQDMEELARLAPRMRQARPTFHSSVYVWAQDVSFALGVPVK